MLDACRPPIGKLGSMRRTVTLLLLMFVKVKENWRESPDILKQMGLASGRGDE